MRKARHALCTAALDRRAFNTHLASLDLATVVPPVVSTGAGAAGEVTCFTWAGYEIPELHPDHVKKYGGSSETTFFAVKQIWRFGQQTLCAARALLRGRQKHARPTPALRTATGELPRMWPEVPPHSRRLSSEYRVAGSPAMGA